MLHDLSDEASMFCMSIVSAEFRRAKADVVDSFVHIGSVDPTFARKVMALMMAVAFLLMYLEYLTFGSSFRDDYPIMITNI